MKDKLAVEILEKNISIRGLIDLGSYSCVGIPYEAAIKAMQAYHEAANKQITDEDIEAYTENIFVLANLFSDAPKELLHKLKSLHRHGARDFRDGLIKHIEP